MNINPIINSHQAVLKHKGIISLGEKVTSKCKYITLLFIKIIACISLIGIIPVFLFINNYYKKIARKTILNENTLIIQNIFDQKITPSTKMIDVLYAKRLIHIDRYIHVDDIPEIKTAIEALKRQEDLNKTTDELQEEFKQQVSTTLPQLAATYGLELPLVEFIINEPGLKQETYDARKERLHEIQAIIENVPLAVVEKFLYNNLTAENLDEQLTQLEWVIDLLKKIAYKQNPAQKICAEAFVVASSEVLLENKDIPTLSALCKDLIDAACKYTELSFSEANAEAIGRALKISIEHQLIINEDNNYTSAINTVKEALDPPLFLLFTTDEKKKKNTTIIETIKHNINF